MPRAERVLVGRERKAGEAGDKIPDADYQQGRGQQPAGREDAETEHDLPQPRQHPKGLRREAHKDEGQRAPAMPAGKLLGRRLDHLVGEAGITRRERVMTSAPMMTAASTAVAIQSPR